MASKCCRRSGLRLHYSATKGSKVAIILLRLRPTSDLSDFLLPIPSVNKLEGRMASSKTAATLCLQARRGVSVCRGRKTNEDRGSGGGVSCFGIFLRSGSGSLARVTPLRFLVVLRS